MAETAEIDPYAEPLADIAGGSGFEALNTEFQKKYKRPLRVTGADTAEHIRLHGKGKAWDLGARDLKPEERDFILSRAPQLGLNVSDYSAAKPHKTATGVSITGPHIHLDLDQPKGGSDPYASVLETLRESQKTSREPLPGAIKTEAKGDSADPYEQILSSLSLKAPAALSSSGEPPIPGSKRFFAEDMPTYAKQYFGGDETKATTYLYSKGVSFGHTPDLKPSQKSSYTISEETGTSRDTTPIPTADELNKRRVQIDVMAMRQVGSPVDIPGYEEAVKSFNEDINRFNAAHKQAGGKGVLRTYQMPNKISEQVDISGKTAADLTPEQQESGLYREWFKARAAGNIADADELGKTYLRQFPQGEHAQYLKIPLRRPITEKQGAQAGAGAYYPVSEIEQMRAQKIPDAQIAKIVQDSIAHQMGLSQQDVDLLTQKYGKHPLSEIFEPGAGGAKTSLASIVKQGKSNAGLAEFRIEPETVRQILGDRELLHPAEIDREKATNAIKSFGGKEFLESLGNDPKSQIEFPELTAVAKLLANSPRAMELISTITAGGLEHASEVSQTAANVAEGAQHPIRSAHKLLSDFLSGGHGKKTPDEHKGYFDELAAQLADDAQNIGAKGGKGAILTPKERIALGLIPGVGQALAAADPTHEGVRKGVKQVLDMFPIVLASELGGAPALGALGYAEKAQEGPKAGFLNAALQAGPFAVLNKSPLGGYVGNAIKEKLAPTAEMLERALSAGTKQEAIDGAAKLLRRKLVSEVAGITAEGATNSAQFLATSIAVQAAGEGRMMTADEIAQQAYLLAAMEAIPAIRRAGEIPGKVRTAKTEATRRTVEEGIRGARDITPKPAGPERQLSEGAIDIEAKEVPSADKRPEPATVRGEATPRAQEETPQAKRRSAEGPQGSESAQAQVGGQNAVEERDQQKGSLGEHPGVPPGRDVSADQGEVRQGDRGQAGGRGVARTEAPQRPQEIAVGDIVTHPRYGKGADLEVTKVRADGSLELSLKRKDGKTVTVPVRKGSEFYDQLQRKGGTPGERQRISDEASRDAEASRGQEADAALAGRGQRQEGKGDARAQGQGRRQVRVEGEGSVEKQAAEPVTKEAAIVSQGEQTKPAAARITERARQAERRAAEAATDKLTGLQSQTQWEGARARIDDDPNTHVARLDFNDLKQVNDNHGHAAGDAYIRKAGKIVREEIAKAGLSERGTFRTGGDELTITGPREAVEKATAEIKRRVAEEIDLPTGAKGSVATGVALTDAAADTAMYADKKAMKAQAAERAKALPDVKTRITADHLNALEERLPKMGAAEKARTHERLLAEEREHVREGEKLARRCAETGGRFSLKEASL